MTHMTGVHQVNGLKIIRINDFELDLSRGLVSGAGNTHRYGYNESVDTVAEETIWPLGGLRPYPSAALQFDVVSDSIQDSSSGTGMIQVLFEGLDENFISLSEVIELNGTTPVTTVGSYTRINRLLQLSTGSNKTNVGNISVTNGGTTYEYIVAGAGRSETAALSIAADFTGYVLNYAHGIGSDKISCEFNAYFVNQLGEALRVNKVHAINGASYHVFEVPPLVFSGTTLEFRAKGINGVANVSTNFDVILIRETVGGIQ